MFKKIVGQTRPPRGHEIDGLHRTQRNNIVIATPVAHYADRPHRQEYGKCLAGLVIKVVLVELFDENVVSILQLFDEVALHFTEHPDTQAWTGEWMAEHHFTRQAQLHTDLANLVFEQLA